MQWFRSHETMKAVASEWPDDAVNRTLQVAAYHCRQNVAAAVGIPQQQSQEPGLLTILWLGAP